MAKVSVIVPIYNIELYLKECVDSLLAQTLEDIQIVLVDDGATDSSGTIIDRYAAADSRVVALHKENGGQSSARNLGLKHAIGEYVLYVDGDDYIVNDAIERLYTAAKEQNADIVQGDLLNDLERMEDPSFRCLDCENQKTTALAYLAETVHAETYDIVPFLYLVRRTFLEQNNLHFAEGYFYEDQLYTLQLLSCENASIVKIRFPFYYYRMDRPGSTTNHITLKKGTDVAYICNAMHRYITEHITGGYKPYCDTVLLISLYQYYRVYLRMHPRDRRIVRHRLDLSALLGDIQSISYHRLLNELRTFARHRRLVEWKWDVKRTLRKWLGR